jgi:integrase
MHDAGIRENPDRDTAITVVGSVTREGEDRLLRVATCRCRTCGGWSSSAIDDTIGLLIPMPVPQCTYFSAAVVSELPESSCDCPDEEDIEADGTHTAEFAKELAPDASLGWCTADSLRGEICARWFIFDEKPAHVHTLSWRQLASTTRQNHIRWLKTLKQMPREFHSASLGAAAVQLVLREAVDKKWSSWGTVACALSSIASALRHLPEYSANRNNIDLSLDPQFASATRRAQHLARVTKRHQTQDALTIQQYGEAVKKCKHPTVRLLLELCWAFAGRVGDIRQLKGRDIVFGDINPSGRQTIHATFRSGKGAAFWGPYTIATNLELSCAKELADLIRERGKTEALFTENEQKALGTAVRETGVTDVRSIRRGRLQHLAQCGASTEDLRLLSGHKRVDTLLRYLGWGLFSSNNKQAAAARDAAEANAAARIIGGECPPEARKMGKHSGYCGNSGQRIRTPPQLFRAPKAVDLGISPDNADNWPLKAKSIDTLSWKHIYDNLMGAGEIIENPDLGVNLLSKEEQQTVKEKLDTCMKWCSAQPMHEAGLPTDGGVNPNDVGSNVAHTNIRRADFDTLIQANKLAPLAKNETVKGWVTGYLIPQAKKKQRRPVWEPHLNRWGLSNQPLATYPARRTRRYLRRHRYIMDFDFCQFFDQFPLAEEAQVYYCCRYRITESDGSHTFMTVKLTRLPMGVTFAPAVAQALTDIIVAPLMKLGDNVKVFTMIDNVRIAASDVHALRHAMNIFLTRCAAAGIAINPQEDIEGNTVNIDPRHLDDEGLTRWALAPKIFLGELIDSQNMVIRNAPKNGAKLVEAWTRISHANLPITASALSTDKTQRRRGDTNQGGKTTITYRHIVSLISLLLFMLHTHDVHLSSCYDLLRPYSKLAARAALVGWDCALTFLDLRLSTTLAQYIEKIVTMDRHGSALPHQPHPPSVSDGDYDVIITSDACGEGWAAFIARPKEGNQVLLKQRWRAGTKTRYDLSTVAEPVALMRALQWVAQQPWYSPEMKIACVSDHAAITTGQRRWWSGNAGFSANPYLNSCYQQMIAMGAIAFFLAGEANPADAPSRSTTLGQKGAVITATITRCQQSLTPPLAELDFPFGLIDADCDTGDDFRDYCLASAKFERPRMMG